MAPRTTSRKQVRTPSTLLLCIAINEALDVLTERPFKLLVPVDGTCDIIFTCLKAATLSLRDKDPSAFGLHKPLNTSISTGTRLPVKLPEGLVDLTTRVDPTVEVRKEFQVNDNPQHVNAIIHIATTRKYIFYYRPTNGLTLSHRYVDGLVALTSGNGPCRFGHDKIEGGRYRKTRAPQLDCKQSYSSGLTAGFCRGF